MAMGRRKPKQEQMFRLPVRAPGHRFYEALSKLLDEMKFDSFAEDVCAPHYAADDEPGRPGLAPGLYFRLLFMGYFENIGSDRELAWRAADSQSVRAFLGLSHYEPTPDSSTISRTRRRLPQDVFDRVFEKVLRVVDEAGLLKGRVRGVDSTYLQADASMKSIVRKDTGESYSAFIKRKAEEEANGKPAGEGSGDGAPPTHGDVAPTSLALGDKPATIEVPRASTANDGAAQTRDDDDDDDDDPSASGGSTDVDRGARVDEQSDPAEAGAAVREASAAISAARVKEQERPRITAEDAVRHDRRRKKTTSNADWHSPSDKDARIMRIKNGTTRLAYKAEHVVDMESGVLLAAKVYTATVHDAASIERSLAAAEANIGAARTGAVVAAPAETGEPWHKEPVAEVVADKGYHKATVLLALKKAGYRTYIPEKKQHGKRKFTDKGGTEASRAFHQNRARTRRAKGKAHQRRRGEMLERPNQHLYDRGGLRRLTTTELPNAQKRVAAQAAAFNLGAVLRQRLGAGAPRWLVAHVLGLLMLVVPLVREGTLANLPSQVFAGAARALHAAASCTAHASSWARRSEIVVVAGDEFSSLHGAVDVLVSCVAALLTFARRGTRWWRERMPMRFRICALAGALG